jgi:hypothetical protein
MTEAAERGYPNRNPFPAIATTSQSERPASPAAGGGGPELMAVELPAVKSVLKVARAYLAGFGDDDIDEYGQAAFVHGDHGSGKTHAVLYALGQMPKSATTPDDVPYRFYAKAEDHDFVAFYRRLMGQLDVAAWRDLSLRFLGRIAGEETGRALGEAAEVGFVQQVRHAPEQVYALSEELRVEPGAVLQTQMAEMSGVVGASKEDFQRALTYLTDPALQDAAYAWLVGRSVTAEQARRLGVSGPITKLEQCRHGIQLLVAMCARIHRPIVIVLDQCERLIFERDDTLCQPNVGVLHSLVEAVPRENGMLVLVGSDDAWWALPRDFRQRVGGNDVLAPVLTPDQAVALLAAYIGAVTGNSLPDDPYPFTVGSVHILLELSGGNVRRLLQQAWEVFDQAPRGKPILQSLVERTAGRGRGRITKGEAKLAIEAVMFEAGVTFQRDWRANGIQADYAVPVSEPRVMIRISQAAFADDEAVEALRHANLIQQMQRAGLTIRVVLVVLGYCSPDVLGQLEQVAHDVIVYDGPPAAERLRPILSQLAGRDATETVIDNDRLEGAIDVLERTTEARDQEMNALRSEFDTLLQRFAQAAEPSGRSAWTQRQQQLRDRIRDERKDRGRQEFTDLEAAHATAERDRRIRFLVAGILGGVLLLVLGLITGSWAAAAGQGLGGALIAVCILSVMLFYVQLPRRRAWALGHLIALGSGLFAGAIGTFTFLEATSALNSFSGGTWYSFGRPVTQSLLITLGILLACACGLAGFSLLETRRTRDLGRSADSIERLGQAARSYAQGVALSRHPLLRASARRRELLTREDPHFRYAGVITAGPDRLAGYDAALARLFMTEPTVIVRRAAARALGTADSDLVQDVLRDGIDAGIPESVYLVEAAPADVISRVVAEPFPESPAILLSRVRHAAPDSTRLLTVVAEAADLKVAEPLLDLLRHWYRNEREIKSHQLPERFLRRAAALLSPFDKDGLGTFDELAIRPDIDDVYLFYEQLIFYREQAPRDE